MNKEGSAVAALLNEINELKVKVRALEATIMPSPRTAREAEEMMRTRENIMGHIHTGATPEWIDTSVPIAEGNIPIRNVTVSRDDTIYATTNDNITIPLTGIRGHYGGATYRGSVNY